MFFYNFCSINAREYIKIDDRTIFGENIKIYDHNHKFSKLGIDIKKQGYSSKKVIIGEHCWKVAM